MLNYPSVCSVNTSQLPHTYWGQHMFPHSKILQIHVFQDKRYLSLISMNLEKKGVDSDVYKNF